MKKKVMVVDDDPDNNISIKAGLEEMDKNIEVLCADSGKECMDMLKNNKVPDIILLDIMMPELCGWEVIGMIKKNEEWKKIPIVFLTARTDVMAKNAGDFLGDDYIEKPYDLEELKKKIDKLLDKKSKA